MIFFLILSFGRILFVQLLAYMWSRIQVVNIKSHPGCTFSVLIPVRNEAQNIINLLKDLESQDYPFKYFEVIIIDDHSEDETMALVNEYISDSSLNIQILQLKDQVGKKAAITSGIQEAKNEYILATDGDCRLPTSWIRSFASRYEQSDSPNMIVAPVLMEATDLFTSIQLMEFSALIGFGGSSLQMGTAATCNGANISYKKSIFNEVEGYSGNENIPSGDDEFLMLKIFRKFKGSIAFLKSREAVVTTPAKQNIKDLINQRIRWSSKWKFHKSSYITSTAMLFFADYAFLIYGVIMAMLGSIHFDLVATILIVRWLTEYYYILNVVKFLGGKTRWINFLIMQIIYPVFVIFLGIASIFGIYHWKGRSYS
ncbi:MAG: glycosyltransferase [Bacteroidota bacterium]